jgi:FkbM family methyltransferase
MSDVIIDLAARRQRYSTVMPLEHPAGVTLPVGGSISASLISPETRSEIASGAYSADLIRCLPDTVTSGDRVMIIGGGLGIVSTLAARVEHVSRVITIDPNTAVCPLIRRVHDLNGVAEIETINAVLAVGKKGKIPFCGQYDARTPSFMSHNQTQLQPMMVPLMDLNMILAEERINVIICDTPTVPAELLAQAKLGNVDRILLNVGNDVVQCWGEHRISGQLAARGFEPEPSGAAILLRRSITQTIGPPEIATPANLNSAPRRVDRGSAEGRSNRFKS